MYGLPKRRVKRTESTWLNSRHRAPVRSSRIMVRCRGDHSPPLESAACSRDTVRLSARTRGPEGTEFAPIHRLRNGTALRTSGEDHAERAAQNRVSSRTVSPRARPPAPLLHHPSRAMRHTQIQQGEYPMKHNTMLMTCPPKSSPAEM